VPTLRQCLGHVQRAEMGNAGARQIADVVVWERDPFAVGTESLGTVTATLHDCGW